MIARRSFLLGLGSLVTASFVTRAQRHARSLGTPLLLEVGRPEETLFLYENPDHSPCDPLALKWRVTLGPDVWPTPPAPTWRAFMQARGERIETPSDVERVARQLQRTPAELDETVHALAWEEHWEHTASPQARAYLLLKELGLDTPLDALGRKAGLVAFTNWGGHPGSSERWVDLRDDLTVSLLQARLVEERLPIRLQIGEMV